MIFSTHIENSPSSYPHPSAGNVDTAEDRQHIAMYLETLLMSDLEYVFKKNARSLGVHRSIIKNDAFSIHEASIGYRIF